MKYRRAVLATLSALSLMAAFAKAEGLQAPAEVSRSIDAIGYPVGGGSTRIDFKGTEMMPAAKGEAKVEAKQGSTSIEADIKNLGQATRFGAEFLTYVIWAISPEGRAENLGELLLNSSGSGKLKASTQLQVFSLVVTAEPYFAVSQPSELVVLENQVRKNTKGKIFPVENYKLLTKAQYQKLGNPLGMTLDLKNVPLEMYEARNALEIARSRDAEKYAPEIYTKAEASTQMAENALARKAGKREIISLARQAVQFSEDARALSMRRQEEERRAAERAAAEEARRLEREKAEQERLQRAQAEAAAAKALQQQQEARQRAEEEARLRAEAEAERKRALEERAREEELRKQAEEEKAQLRARLLEQFSRVLETRDTERGLVVQMSDVLFDTGSYTLRQEAREKLARIAGIVINYPGLKLAAEGHTDNVGSEEFNQKLSEQRAESVRSYLISQGVPEATITAVGRGFSMPVASNDTPAGRQKNRRVELIVSGEVIGTTVGAKP